MNRFFIMLLLIFLVMSRNANANLSTNIMINCAIDYFKYCSQYPVNSDEVKDCFRKVGSKLEPMCIKALDQENMIPEEDKTKAKEEAIKKVDESSKSAPETSPVVVPDAQPFSGAPDIKQSQKKVKETIIEDIKKRVEKLKEKATQSVSKPVYVKSGKTYRKRKIETQGKWKGYTLYVEWNDGGHREYGNELTLYGYEDRR